jgi:hypothetical protein
MPQKSVPEAEDELAIRGVFEQAKRSLVDGFAIRGRGRFSRLEPICQSRFELGMTVAMFQGPLKTGGYSDEVGEIGGSLG